MKKKIVIASFILTVAVVVVYAAGLGPFRLRMTGFEEVPAVSTKAEGTFTAHFNHDRTAISYELKYSGLEGDVTQAHIHLGQKGVNGGVTVFLCANPPIMAPPGTQACPPSPATITGTITAANVGPIAAQGLAAGEFDELVRAIRTGNTYANVHSTKFPGGEIRAQLIQGRRHGHDEDDADDNDQDQIHGHNH